MIKRITLHDCKTYDDAAVDLTPGVNIVTGGSGQGKSNILAGLKWVLLNTPKKNRCIRRGQPRGEAEITVEDNGHTMSASRFKAIKGGENGYAITEDGKLIGEYEGSEVPADVTQLLNMREINIHRQLKPHFLVFDTPGKIAEYIRSVTRLNDIDLTRKSITSQKRAATDALVSANLDLDTKIGQLQKLQDLPLDKMRELIDEATKINEETKDIETEIATLEKIIDNVYKIDRFSLTLPDNTGIILSTVEELVASNETAIAECNKLQAILVAVQEIDASRVKIDWTRFLNVEKEISELLDANDSKNTRIDSLMGIIESIAAMDSELHDIATAIAKEEAEYRELLEQLDTCHECGSILTEDCKAKLLETKL